MLRKCYKSNADYKKAKAKERNRYYGESSFIYGHRDWTEVEEWILINFTGTDRELSPIIERSVKAIQHRRAKLKGLKVEDPYV